VSFSPDGKNVAAGYWQIPDGHGAVWVWDLKGQKPVESSRLLIKQDFSDYVDALLFLHDGKSLVTGGVNSTLFWDLENPKRDPRKLERFYAPYALSPDGKTMAGSNGNYSIKLLDLGQATPRLKAQLDQGDDTSGEEALAFSPDGRKLAVSNRSGKVTIWDASSYKVLFEWEDAGTGWRYCFFPGQ
jgi:WD40 repeat protein